MKIYSVINKLISYAKNNLELDSRNEVLVRNNIIDMLGLPSFEVESAECESNNIAELLDEFTSVAVEENVFESDLAPYFCDKVMGALSLLPSDIDKRFCEELDKGAENATEWFYNYCVSNNYVKKAVLDKNPRFDGDNGLVVTINLAKPEFRDPNKAKSGNSVAGGYPSCVICRDNEGFTKRGKSTLRSVSLQLDGKPWFWQFSPYGYFYQHGICVNTVHTPMHIDRQTFVNLFDFIDKFPHYFIGCNAALERIGGSVLAHDHYQGGGEILPLFKAPLKCQFAFNGYDDVTIGILDWPGTVIRLISKNKEHLIELGDIIRHAWFNYTNKDLQIVCKDENGQHNSISPTVVKNNGNYELNIILRSNITSAQYPDGIFHAHPEFHVIKKESIGLIEAQGLFILPGRLVGELARVEECVKNGKLVDELKDFELVFNEVTAIANGNLKSENIHNAVKTELASICYRILQNTAVFNCEQTADFLKAIGFEAK